MSVAAVCGFIVLLLSVSVAQAGWWVTCSPTEICALKGSTVSIRCTYGYPTDTLRVPAVEKRFWFIKDYKDLQTDPDYADRVTYICELNKCTMNITDLRVSDSAKYKFRFIVNDQTGKITGEPGVSVSVTDLWVKTTYYNSVSKWSDLRCESSCSLPHDPTYIWYKNGQKSQRQTQILTFDSVGFNTVYSCAVEGHENLQSPSVSVPWGVTYTSPHVCGLKGSTVKIHCSYMYPSRIDYYEVRVTRKFWFVKKDNEEPGSLTNNQDYLQRVNYDCDQKSCTLTIRDLRQSDSDNRYKFRFITDSDGGKYTGEPGVSVSVTDQLQLDVRKASNWTVLTCRSGCQHPDLSYVWFKDGQKVPTTGKTYSLLNSSDPSGRYYCAIKGHERLLSPSVYAPDVPSVSVVPSGEIVENSSVTLNCSSDANPAANYTWYKRDSHPESIHEGPQLVFSSIQSSDSGQFYCRAENELGRRRSESIYVDVRYAPKMISVSVVPSGEIVEDSSVTLTCSSDANPAANYTWYKEDEESPKASGQNFTITDVRAEDGGDYSCVARNHRGSRRSVVHVTVVTSWMKSAAAGSLSAVIVLILFLFVFLWVRKKRFFKETPGRVEIRRTNPQLNAASEYDVPPAAAHRKPAEQQDDLFYASIIFSKSQDDALYSNVGAARLNRRSSDEEDVEYTMVNVQGVSPSPQLRCREAEEDSSPLYSTVNKPHRA